MKIDYDKVERTILQCFLKNARMSSADIAEELRVNGIKRTARAVLARINRLEREGRIAGYTLKTHPKNFEDKVMRFVLISFKTSPIFNERVAMFTSYLQNAPFAAFAARTRGEYDWINIKIFPNTRIANLESDTYRTIFGDIIDKYTAYDFTIVKPPNFFQAANYTNEEFYEFYEKWANRDKLTQLNVQEW